MVPAEDGLDWVCGNSFCRGFGQVGREITAEDRKLIDLVQSLADRHWEDRAKAAK
jgi:hypothetical protein